MTLLRHRPYVGPAKPFTIGMRPLDIDRWFEPDEHFAVEMAQKRALFDTRRETVFRQQAGSEAAQREVWSLLHQHLTDRFPQLRSVAVEGVTLSRTGETITPDDGNPPLLAAARLVQDDLCILERGQTEWHLTAAALCFPSTWSLAEKIGKPMSAIHAEVPDFAGQMESRVARIFDHLRPETPVERFNWSIYADNELHHPETRSNPARFDGRDMEDGAFIRVERQTLRRLPETGAILFTIRVYVDPLAAFRRVEGGAALADALRKQLLGLSEAQTAYKGLTKARDRLASALQCIAEKGDVA